MKSLFLPVLGLLAAVFAIVSIIRWQPRRPATDPPAPPPTSRFTNTVAAVGLVEASSENIALGTPLSGVVHQVQARVGRSVAAGEALFELDTRQLRAERASRAAVVAATDCRAQTATTVLEDQQDQFRRAEQLARTDVISPDELTRRRFALRTAEARVAEARAEIATAQAALAAIDIELERSVVRAPLAAEVLQVNVRPGEFAPAGVLERPLIVLGQLHPLHVRVDVDEHEGWRVRPESEAVGHLRGDSKISAPLKFVRFEPLVVPKRSLTGDATERVDTRVLQIIYEVTAAGAPPLLVGQQLDVFIAGVPGH